MYLSGRFDLSSKSSLTCTLIYYYIAFENAIPAEHKKGYLD